MILHGLENLFACLLSTVFAYYSCLKLLLLHDGKVNMTARSGWTPLHFSSTNDHSECCRYLLENGARLDAVTAVSITAAEMDSIIFKCN